MAITYKDIEKANGLTTPTDIKGKSYMEVNQRIKAFRMVYPTGTIETVMVSNENGVCIFRATVGYYGENDYFVTLGTGTAYEKEGSSFINKTSYIENCETSAVGRALGMAGFGIDTSVASAEEVQNAMANQNKTTKDDPIDEIKIQTLKEDIKNGVVKDEKALFKFFRVTNYSQITEAMFRDYVAKRELQAKK